MVMGFIVPVAVLTFCYCSILRFVTSHTREMNLLSQKGSFRKNRKKTDIRTAQIILSLALLFYIAWTPYSVVSFIGTTCSFMLRTLSMYTA